MPTPHISNDQKLSQLARDRNNLLKRQERQWVVFDVRMNYRADEARIDGTLEIENIVSKCHEAGYLLYKIDNYAVPAMAGPRVHLLLIFRAQELHV